MNGLVTVTITSNSTNGLMIGQGDSMFQTFTNLTSNTTVLPMNTSYLVFWNTNPSYTLVTVTVSSYLPTTGSVAAFLKAMTVGVLAVFATLSF